MTLKLGKGPDEITMNVCKEDDDAMLPYIMKLMAEGFRVVNVDDDTIMIKYYGYSLVNRKAKTITAVVKKPDY